MTVEQFLELEQHARAFDRRGFAPGGKRGFSGSDRGIHLGDTIIGTKGRVAFEAPAAEVLLTAHRELEKLTLSARQQRIKELLAQPYGDLVHEGQLLDPVCRDIEALLSCSQQRVTGVVKLLLQTGADQVTLLVKKVRSTQDSESGSRSEVTLALWQNAQGAGQQVQVTAIS